jgi:hypothetical protein
MPSTYVAKLAGADTESLSSAINKRRANVCRLLYEAKTPVTPPTAKMTWRPTKFQVHVLILRTAKWNPM